jgi:reductive dehalogenase
MWEESPEQTSKVLEKVSKYFGAAQIGFCELDRRWVFSHDRGGKEIVFEDVDNWYSTAKKMVIPKSHRNVIVLTLPMEFEEFQYAPTPLNITSNMGYSRMAILAGTIAEFIRGLGWNAIPCGNDTAISVPLAIQAGLGHMGRHGRLITWEHGSLVRICKIFTDLPVQYSQLAPTGIIEFCEVCQRCATKCPVQAIPEDERTYQGVSEANNPGVYKWFIDADECLRYWREIGSGCAICFRVCPFTKPNTAIHRLVKWFIRKTPALNRFWVWSDKVMGYGKLKDPNKYWT